MIYFVLFCLFILSLSPNTHADSLDYHFLSAKHIIETGNLSTDLTHFHSRLSGAGETLIAIGLIFWIRTIWKFNSIFRIGKSFWNLFKV